MLSKNGEEVMVCCVFERMWDILEVLLEGLSVHHHRSVDLLHELNLQESDTEYCEQIKVDGVKAVNGKLHPRLAHEARKKLIWVQSETLSHVLGTLYLNSNTLVYCTVLTTVGCLSLICLSAISGGRYFTLQGFVALMILLD